jgi:hypothetical protein
MEDETRPDEHQQAQRSVVVFDRSQEAPRNDKAKRECGC